MVIYQRESGRLADPLIERAREACLDVDDTLAGAADRVMVVVAHRLILRAALRDRGPGGELCFYERIENAVCGRGIEFPLPLQDELFDRDRRGCGAEQRKQPDPLLRAAEPHALQVLGDSGPCVHAPMIPHRLSTCE